MTPALTALLAHLERELAGLPPEEIPAALGELERLRALIWPRLMAGENRSAKEPSEDRLLTVKEAAGILGTSQDWLYRNASRLPFMVRLGEAQVRFSCRGIQKWIRLRTGTETA